MTNKTKPKLTLRIIKKSTCPKLSPTAKGELTYHVGYDEIEITIKAEPSQLNISQALM